MKSKENKIESRFFRIVDARSDITFIVWSYIYV